MNAPSDGWWPIIAEEQFPSIADRPFLATETRAMQPQPSGNRQHRKGQPCQYGGFPPDKGISWRHANADATRNSWFSQSKTPNTTIEPP